MSERETLGPSATTEFSKILGELKSDAPAEQVTPTDRRHAQTRLTRQAERVAEIAGRTAEQGGGREPLAFVQARAALKGLVSLGDEHVIDSIIDDILASHAALVDRVADLEALQKADNDVFDRFVPRKDREGEQG